MNIFTNKSQMTNIDETLTKNRLQNKVFAEQIDILYTNLLISVPSSLLCATIVFIALYRIAHTNLLIYWFIATVFMSVLRLDSFWALYPRSKMYKITILSLFFIDHYNCCDLGFCWFFSHA